MKIKFALVSVLFLLLSGTSHALLAQKSELLSYQVIRNERYVIQALRTIHGAQATYQATSGNGNFGSLAQLGQAGLISEVLAGGEIYRYVFTLTKQDGTPTTPASFQVVAVPQQYPRTGRRSFFTNEYGLIRGADKQGAPATQNDPFIVEEYTCYSIEECEAKAMFILRTIHGAEMAYQATNGSGNFGSLCQLGQQNLVNELVASGERFGYYFVVSHRNRVGNQQATFEVIAIPRRYNQTGRRSFYIATDGVTRGADRNGAPATADDPWIEN